MTDKRRSHEEPNGQSTTLQDHLQLLNQVFQIILLFTTNLVYIIFQFIYSLILVCDTAVKVAVRKVRQRRLKKSQKSQAKINPTQRRKSGFLKDLLLTVGRSYLSTAEGAEAVALMRGVGYFAMAYFNEMYMQWERNNTAYRRTRNSSHVNEDVDGFNDSERSYRAFGSEEPITTSALLKNLFDRYTMPLNGRDEEHDNRMEEHKGSMWRFAEELMPIFRAFADERGLKFE